MKNFSEKVVDELNYQIKSSRLFIPMILIAIALSLIISNNQITVLEKQKITAGQQSSAILSVFIKDGKNYIMSDNNIPDSTISTLIFERFDISSATMFISIFIFFMGIFSFARLKKNNGNVLNLRNIINYFPAILGALATISLLTVFVLFLIPVIRIMFASELHFSMIELQSVLNIFFHECMYLFIFTIMSLLLTLLSGNKKSTAFFLNIVLWMLILQIAPLPVERILGYVVLFCILINVYNSLIKYLKCKTDYVRKIRNQNEI